MTYLYKFINTIKVDKDKKANYEDIKISRSENPYSLSTPHLIPIFETFILTFDSIIVVERSEADNSPIDLVAQKALLKKVSDIDKQSITELSKSLSNFIIAEFTLQQNSRDANLFDASWGPYFSGLRELLDLHEFVRKYILSKNKLYRNGCIFITEK